MGTNLDISYTPLIQDELKPKKNHSSFLFYNFIGFFLAIFIIVNFLIIKNLNKAQTYQSKADEIKVIDCPLFLDINPKKVKAYIVDEEGAKTEIQPKASVSPNNKIMFEWEIIKQATSYFVALGNISPTFPEGRIDPVLKGVTTQLNSYTVSSLSAKTNYYLFIRSNSPKGIGISFPDKSKCNDYLPALPIFEFTTE